MNIRDEMELEISLDCGRFPNDGEMAELRQRSDRVYGDVDYRWLPSLANGLDYRLYVVAARKAGTLVGVLPLAYVKSIVFGRYLVSLPYINTGGLVVSSQEAATKLIDRAVNLADELKVKHLQLRHEAMFEHSSLGDSLTSKVHMRLPLDEPPDLFWKALTAKVRNQVRKGEKHELTIEWGRDDRLNDFYEVFAHNMRDLGTPVFGRKLFRSILASFGEDAEFCIAYKGDKPIAAGLLIHSENMTEVPSASSLREHNKLNANMLMYWHLLKRAIERGQSAFDFGRTTEGSNTFKFKKQWGATASPAIWQYYVRSGSVGETRPDTGNYGRAIETWQKLPVWLTKLVGPRLVRGIP